MITLNRELISVCCCIILCFCAAGCRKSSLVSVVGSVTYDGKAVAKGNVSFLPCDGKGPTAAAIIVDGKYTAKVAPGKKQVRIEGFDVTGQQHYMGDPKAPMIDIQEPLIPECYNARSELACEISPSGGVYDFTLKKPR